MATHHQATGRRSGPAPMPVEKQRLLGNPGKRALPPVPAPEAALVVIHADHIPAPPAGLGEAGRDAWEYIWRGGRRWLSEEQDALLIRQLCRQFDIIHECEKRLGGVENYIMDGYRPYPNPLLGVIKEANFQITVWLSMLGFSPSDRARLGLAEIRIHNQLDEFRERKARRELERQQELAKQGRDGTVNSG